MVDYIDRQAAIDALMVAIDDVGVLDGDDIKAVFDNLPSAQPEHLHTVMEKIGKRYAKAMNTPRIKNPMAWALYETWKEYDR